MGDYKSPLLIKKNGCVRKTRKALCWRIESVKFFPNVRASPKDECSAASVS